MRNDPDDASQNHPSQCEYLGHRLVDQTVVAIQTVFAKQHEAADHQANDECCQAEAGDNSPRYSWAVWWTQIEWRTEKGKFQG